MCVFFKGYFLYFFMHIIQHCFFCRPSDSTVSEDAGIEPRTVATLALTARCSNLSAHPPSLTTAKKVRTSFDIFFGLHPPGKEAGLSDICQYGIWNMAHPALPNQIFTTYNITIGNHYKYINIILNTHSCFYKLFFCPFLSIKFFRYFQRKT